ncbi:MAG: class I SAM-dependent methyltransferase [Planctomycetes bacterium]|nr:class I SAM-dependent methyltransferase [Planctomycetota bacterium]
MKRASTPLYGEDLAYVHDVGFGAFAKTAAPGLLRLLRRHGIASGRVVDLGCGPGSWARTLGRAGYEVLGVDISKAMIARARRHAPMAKFVCASLHDVELPPCDAVTSLGECVNYLFDRKASRASLHRLFRRVHAALRPGGLFVFDVSDEQHRLRLYSRAELSSDLRDAGFTVRTLTAYGRTPFPKGYVAFVSRKRESRGERSTRGKTGGDRASPARAS